MRDPAVDLVGLLDLYERVVADAAPHLSVQIVEPIAVIGRAVRRKRQLAGEVSLIGLLGGTGSGKSSLLNALAGTEVSVSGVRRPTTSEPLAWVPARSGPALAAMLDVLKIQTRIEHDRKVPLAILDLPDIDSLVTRHRQLVSEVVPYLDVVVWVIDPEKYHDRIFHELVRSVSSHEAVFRFVVNQIDRLEQSELVPLTADLARTLRSDGVSTPIIWTAAADPPVGPSVGVDEIWEKLCEVNPTGVDRDQEMVNELAIGAAHLSPLVQPVDFSRRWDDLVSRAADLIGRGRSAEAHRELWMFAHDLFPGVRFDLAAVVGEAGASAEPARTLDVTIGREFRDRLRPRARTLALLTELELALNEAASPTPDPEQRAKS